MIMSCMNAEKQRKLKNIIKNNYETFSYMF